MPDKKRKSHLLFAQISQIRAIAASLLLECSNLFNTFAKSIAVGELIFDFSRNYSFFGELTQAQHEKHSKLLDAAFETHKMYQTATCKNERN